MMKTNYAYLDRRREMFDSVITQIPEGFFEEGGEWCDRIYHHQGEAENYYRAIWPNVGDDAWALAYDEASILAYAAHLFGAAIVRDFVDAAADGREHRLIARRIAKHFGAAVVDEIASAIRERATFDASAVRSAPRLVVDNTGEAAEILEGHRTAVTRAFAALPLDAANAELRPLWEAVRRDSEARACRRYPGESAEDLATLAQREARVLQFVADQLGDERLANIVNAVGDYRRFGDDELTAAKRESITTYSGDHDITDTLLFAIRGLDEMAA
jgi:hypothetical protein